MNLSQKQFTVVATVVGISLTALQLPSNSVLRGQSQDIPVNEFTSDQVAEGVVLPADAHNFFTCTTGGSVSTHATSLGNVRAWTYEFTGNEPPFNGEFFISEGELAVNPQYDSLDTLETFKEDRRYYVMNNTDLFYKCGEGLSLREYCGDNIKQENEECDDGNTSDGDGCSQECTIEAVCGNGELEGEEECDDSNTANRDGCDNECQSETGYTCSGEPSECEMLIPTLGGAGTSSSAGYSTSGISAYTSTPSSYGHLSSDSVSSPTTSSFGMSSLVSSSTHSTNSNDARHTVCQNNQCVDVVGVGTNECNSNSDCGGVPVSAHVAQKDIGTGDIAVEHQKNINLLRFEVRADGADLLFTGALFEAKYGSVNNATNYALWVDTDYDGTVDTILEYGVPPMFSQVNFDGLAGGGYVVPDDTDVVFEVHADVAGSLSTEDLQLMFDDGATTDEFAMEVLSNGSPLFDISRDGQCDSSSCDMTLNTVDSQLWTFVSQGDLYVTKDVVPLRNRQLLGGTVGDAVLRLEFRAENEDIDVTDLQISAPPQSRSIDRFELYFDGESTKFADATKGGCGNDEVAYPEHTFCANMENQQLVIPKGRDIEVIIRPRMRSDLVGGISGDAFNTHLSGIVATNFPGAVRARGAESSNDLLQNNSDTIAEGEIFIGAESAGPNQSITGEDETVVMSKITSITNANPDSNGSSVPIGISA
ncbi:MAG: myxococcus cysteine-rich repeat containing protein, partial [Candidatus Peribacteraceae bacterium]|nr:myxococcus cysteine-rich repeat containing protein [Candidatus Peribacteraceae bacterium]